MVSSVNPTHGKPVFVFMVQNMLEGEQGLQLLLLLFGQIKISVKGFSLQHTCYMIRASSEFTGYLREIYRSLGCHGGSQFPGLLGEILSLSSSQLTTYTPQVIFYLFFFFDVVHLLSFSPGTSEGFEIIMFSSNY